MWVYYRVHLCLTPAGITGVMLCYVNGILKLMAFFRVKYNQMVRLRPGWDVRLVLTEIRVPSLPLYAGVPRTFETVT